MKHILTLLICISITACAQQKQDIQGETAWQQEMNQDFRDATKSPLTQKDRKYFQGLDFFKNDSTYVVTATLKRNENPEPFQMQTTTDRKPIYTTYGTVTFSLFGKTHTLNIYQGIELSKREGYADYLFLPFLDNTNGKISYKGGRYIECRIPQGNTLVIDFNKAYNPYCAYNKKYSCPIVPKENFINQAVNAGVKKFH